MSKKKPEPSTSERLKAMIIAHANGRSFSAIAREAGMSSQQLDGILSGKRKSPKIETIHRILAAIGVDECWACGGTGKRPKV